MADEQAQQAPDPEPEPGLIVERRDGVLWLTINRPARRNALDGPTNDALIAALTDASTDDTLRAIVLTGAGSTFCTGFDLGGAGRSQADTPRRTGSVQRSLPVGPHRTIELLRAVQLPIIASVRGYACGMGLHLALAADYVVAAEGTLLFDPFVQRGFNADSGGSWMLPRFIGVARAKELLLLGRRITAEKAEAWGLINEVVPDDQLEAATDAVAEEFRRSATVAVGMTKWLVNHGLDHDFKTHIDTEAVAVELCLRSADFTEGIRALQERRSPDFTGM
jgi:2-(1,2-epoxy-1,2-dihydrophenyl)acetyl-CoA isomerase